MFAGTGESGVVAETRVRFGWVTGESERCAVVLKQRPQGSVQQQILSSISDTEPFSPPSYEWRIPPVAACSGGRFGKGVVEDHLHMLTSLRRA
jgi:hypothetical protein